MPTLTPMESFKKDGYYIARNLIDHKEITTMMAQLHKNFNDQLAFLGETVSDEDIFASMQRLHAKDIERYKKLVGAIWRKIEVYNLMHHRNILKFLSDQFGWQDIFVPGGQVALIMAEELRIPDGYFGLIPHQDFPSVQGSLDGVVVWLPLVDVDAHNYPLEVIPDSHLNGILPATESSNKTWEIAKDHCKDEAFVPVEVKAGDVVFMSLFTVHRSSQKGTAGRFRVAFSTRFDNADEATFIERCYPTAYLRTVHREQYFPGFPTPDQVSHIFKAK